MREESQGTCNQAENRFSAVTDTLIEYYETG